MKNHEGEINQHPSLANASVEISMGSWVLAAGIGGTVAAALAVICSFHSMSFHGYIHYDIITYTSISSPFCACQLKCSGAKCRTYNNCKPQLTLLASPTI